MQGDRSAIALQDVAYGGLDAVRAVVPVDLCAYLHVSPGLGPQLYLRAPDLSTLDATAAFGLFGSLRDVLAVAQLGTQRLEVGGFQSIVVLCEGEVSRGLFVFGRGEVPIGEDEARVISPLCAAVGVAAHALEAAVHPSVDFGGLKVAVTPGPSGSSQAEVLVPVGGDLRRGVDGAPTAVEAVARATLQALEATIKLVSISECDVGGDPVIVALVRANDDRLAAGAAPADPASPLEAAATAVAEAAVKLQPLA